MPASSGLPTPHPTPRRKRPEMPDLPLRPVEILLPDVRSAAFLAAAAEQSRRVAAAEEDDEIMRFIEAVADTDDDD